MNNSLFTNIGGSDGVHILVRKDPIEESGGLDLMLAVQGHLDHHTVDISSLVKLVNFFEQLVLGDACRKVDMLGVDSNLLRIKFIYWPTMVFAYNSFLPSTNMFMFTVPLILIQFFKF